MCGAAHWGCIELLAGGGREECARSRPSLGLSLWPGRRRPLEEASPPEPAGEGRQRVQTGWRTQDEDEDEEVGEHEEDADEDEPGSRGRGRGRG